MTTASACPVDTQGKPKPGVRVNEVDFPENQPGYRIRRSDCGIMISWLAS
jgi:hypothetical protein